MIPVKNIYYMLTYAFSLLKEGNYQNLDDEEFENTSDLMAAILITGISNLIKRGFNKEYIETTEDLISLKGRINITHSLQRHTMIMHRLSCDFDEYSFDCVKNQILKTTLLDLMKEDVTKDHKKSIRNLLFYFKDISEVDLDYVNWNQTYDRNNQTYRLLIAICYFVKKGLLQSSKEGKNKIKNYVNDDTLYHLYEKFLVEYYRKVYPQLNAKSPKINWQLDSESIYDSKLPNMNTDLVLAKDNKILIVDAKYYQNVYQTHFNKETYHSGNMYQIFTYVKNKEYEVKDKNIIVSGLLLYAKTEQADDIEASYMMSGNKISIMTLDLNQDWEIITGTLNNIVKLEFEI